MPQDYQLGDAPIENEQRERMKEIAAFLDHQFNGENAQRKWGFVMLVYRFGDTGRCNFISNGADRKDIVALMKEMIARFEGQPDIIGHA